jgi:hypothetical protein
MDGQPADTIAGRTITPAVKVEILDAFGARLTNCAAGNPNCSLPLTIAIASNPPAPGTLSGTKMRNAVDGVAIFDNLLIDTAGTGYILKASSATLASALSQPFNIGVANTILVYGPTLHAVTTEDPTNEETVAVASGYAVTVRDAAWWTDTARTKADFSAFNGIVFPDPHCVFDGGAGLATAAGTTGKWSPAVTGPKVVVGTDPVFHADPAVTDGTAPEKLMRNAINFAASGTSTGMYMSLGCSYGSAATATDVPALSGFGNFKVRGQDGGCPVNVQVLDTAHPVMSGLTNENMSNWDCSMHEWFSSALPAGWRALAQETSLPTPRIFIIAKP